MLDNILECLGAGYTDPEAITEYVTRKMGLSACDVLAESERRREVIENLQVILGCLTENQQKILLMTGAGYTVREMEEVTGITHQTMVECRQGIPARLLKYSDECRIEKLAEQIERLEAKGKLGRKYQELRNEYESRHAVREALKNLFVILTPPESTKEADGGVSMPAYSFERAMNVETGMKKGIEDGRHVMKTVSKCKIPEYFSDTFGQKFVCCTLCATCKRKKDVSGRRDYGKYGLEN